MSAEEKNLVVSTAKSAVQLIEEVGESGARLILAGMEMQKAVYAAKSPTPADPGVTSTPDSAA